MRKLINRGRKAFTLVELMFVLAIIGLAATAAYNAWLEGWVNQKTTSEKLMMLADLRLIGKEMMKEARNANRFYIFESFPAQLDSEGAVTSGTEVAPGSTGNYLVLDSVVFGNVLERTIYYLDGTGSVRKFRQTYNGSGVPALPASSTGHRELLKDVTGNNTDNQLFFNSNGQSILVEGKFTDNINQAAAGGATVQTERTFSFHLQPLQE